MPPVPFPFRSPVSVVEPVPPLPTPSVPKMELAENVEVAETTPSAFVCRKPLAAPKTERLLVVRFVVLAVALYIVPLTLIFVLDAPPLKVWRSDHVFLSARSVDEAAVIVISAVPLNETPLMVRGF